MSHSNSSRAQTCNRVALLHYTASPVIGGVEAAMASHARLLADHGYAPIMVAGRAEASDPTVEVRVNPLLDSRHPGVLSAQADLARGHVTAEFRALTARLREALSEALSDCDVCVAHNVATLHKNLALTVALHELVSAGSLRLIAWCHDFAWTDPLYQPELHPGEPWDLLRTRWHATTYVTVSHSRRAMLCELLSMAEADVRVITAGIDPGEFLGISAQTAAWVEKFGWAQVEPLMLLPARVTRRKNIELAIEITAALRKQGAHPQLVVMGPLGAHNPANASYLRALRDLAAERGVGDAITFLCEHGAVSDAVRRDLYLLADLLIFPSTQEGFGVPVLEGGLARLPVFCSDIVPFRESAGDAAHFFDLNEPPEQIARRMSEILARDPAYRLRRRVLRDYSWPRIWARQLEPLLREVAADGRL